MHLKRYRGKTLKDALRAVRQDLGPRRPGAVHAGGAGARLARMDGRRAWSRSRPRRSSAATCRTAVTDRRTIRLTAQVRARLAVAARRQRPRAGGWPERDRRVASGRAPPRRRRRQPARDARRARCASLARAGRRLRAGGSVRRPARRRQDHDDRQDRRAGARAPAAAASGSSPPTASASARSSSCALYAEIIGAPLTVARSADELDRRARRPRAGRCSSTPPGRSPGDDVSREMFRVVGRAAGRAHAPGAAGEHAAAPRAAHPRALRTRRARRARDHASSTKPNRWPRCVGVLQRAPACPSRIWAPGSACRKTCSAPRRPRSGRLGARRTPRSGAIRMRPSQTTATPGPPCSPSPAARAAWARPTSRSTSRSPWRGSACASACSTPTSASATSTCCSGSRRAARRAHRRRREDALRDRRARAARRRDHSGQLGAAVA